MEQDYLSRARELAPEFHKQREYLHRHPEPGNAEYLTAAFIEAELNRMGISTERLLDTAVVGILRTGRPGPACALRADMDSLPVQEETGVSYASEVPGRMHACGHDVHMAAVLGAARLLAEHREDLCGEIRFFFQPDEEGHGGAARMIRASCMGNVQAVFGAHVAPDLPAGTVGIRYGKFYAASDMFTVRLVGRSAHGAQPEKGIDALAAASELVCALRELPGRVSEDRCVLTVGRLQAGTARNVLAGEAVMEGILRTLGSENRSRMKKALRDTVQSIADKTGTIAELTIEESYSGVVNTEPETALVAQTARVLLGEQNVEQIAEPLMTTEDVGCFIDASSGSFYHIGAGCALPLHNSSFLPDGGILPAAAALHAAVVTAYLNLHKE